MGGGGGGGGTLNFHAYVGSDPASTVYKKKISSLKGTPKQEMSQTRDECPQRNWSSIRHI